MSTPTSSGKRFPIRNYVIGYLAIIVLSIVPLLITVVAVGFAAVNGCRMDEASSYPCVVFGHDWGDTLYTMGVMAWMMLVTMPLGFLLLILLAMIMLAHLLIHRTRKRRTVNNLT